jgi:hypothetical protein
VSAFSLIRIPIPATDVPKLIQIFDTDAGTAVGDLVRVSGVNYVSTITDNTIPTIPNGMFGVCITKPSSITAGILFVGIIDAYSGFTEGLPLFISTSGVPTHTPPATGVLQQIGFAVSSTAFFVNMLQAMQRA